MLAAYRYGARVNPEERRYYDLRAPEYDDWYLGRGPFAGRERPGWQAETDELGRFVASLPAVRTLDVACGTGFLTRHLPGQVTALDQSRAMLAVAAERLPHVALVQGDGLDLPFPDDSFGLVFTGHFYGHLHEGDRLRFLAEARRVGGRVVVVDSAVRAGEEDGPQVRELADGSSHVVFKRYFTADGLAAELGGTPLFDGAWYVAAGT
jgi:demethylmenaquinone methyltransferase/2-methoxy-6-polyprenyl-1,4-benzoquinol methylase